MKLNQKIMKKLTILIMFVLAAVGFTAMQCERSPKQKVEKVSTKKVVKSIIFNKKTGKMETEFATAAEMTSATEWHYSYLPSVCDDPENPGATVEFIISYSEGTPQQLGPGWESVTANTPFNEATCLQYKRINGGSWIGDPAWEFWFMACI